MIAAQGHRGAAAVTFDGAGTLIHPRRSVGLIYSEIARKYGAVCEPGEIERRFWQAFRTAPPLCFPNAMGEQREALERRWWEQVVREVFREGRLSNFSAFFAELYATFADPASWAVFSDVLPTFIGLRARGIRLGVVSNFDSRLERLLVGLQLRPWLDVVVTSSCAGVAKPDAEIFLAAAQGLAFPPHRIWHVGDDPVDDVAGAESAGFTAFLIERKAQGRRECLTDLRQLLGLLDLGGTKPGTSCTAAG